MTESNERRHTFGNYCVGLVDVLNQRQSLAQWATLPEGPGAKEELIRRLQGNVIPLIRFRKRANDIVSGFAKDADNAQLAQQLPDHERQHYLNLTRSTLKLQAFSDTLVWYSPLRSIGGEPVLKDVVGMLGGLGFLMLSCLAERTAIRGAIEIGTGTDVFEDEIYGPCLSITHQLESECAGYPRILVGPQLVAIIQSLIREGDQEAPFAALVAQSLVSRLITKDHDGWMILDWLGPYLRNFAANTKEDICLDAAAKAWEFVNSQRKSLREASDCKLLPRYEQLAAYMQSRRAEWQLPKD